MNFLKKHKNDIFLILVLLALSGGLLAWREMTKRAGGEAVVTVDGAEVWRASLSRDAQWDYIGPGGEAGNRIVIENGAVRVDSADCPDLVCVRTGSIRYDGEQIVCLPHRLVVRVTGAPGETDAVAN